MKKRVWLHRVGMLGALASGAGSASAQDSANLPVPRTTFGINLAAPNYWVEQPVFANLLIGSSWTSRIPGHAELTPDEVDKDGNLQKLPGNQPVGRVLTLPNSDPAPTTIRCIYDGKGIIKPTMASVQDMHLGQGEFTYRWRYTGYKTSVVILLVSAIDSADPIRNLDCRDARLDPKTRFTPQFLAFARQFKILRFMDWQRTNDNARLAWSTRHTRESTSLRRGGGVSIEDMVDLAEQTGAEPWFNMPWNGDEDYIRHFAQYVHDHLPRERHVYVEAGNEVWNAGFAASKQAALESIAEGLSTDPNLGRMMRYSERFVQIMDIWSDVFRDRPGQLVRVAGCQNGPTCVSRILNYKDTARHIDAIATAPYFGYFFHKNPPRDVNEAFGRMDQAIDDSLANALKVKAIAHQFHKRYIAYEAGQHIVLGDVDLERQIEHDPRMYDAYKRYLSVWRAKIGDTIMLYESVQPIRKSGAWGLLDYLGQPLADAPKMRAVTEALESQSR